MKISEYKALSTIPSIRIPDALLPIGPMDQTEETLQLEQLSTRLYSSVWNISFNFDFFKGPILIAKNKGITEEYPLFRLWGVNGSHLHHVAINDDIFIENYIKEMQAEYRDSKKSASFENPDLKEEPKFKAFKYAMLDYSDGAFDSGINQLLRGNDRELINRLISLEYYPHNKLPETINSDFILSGHRHYKLWYKNDAQFEKIRIQDIPDLTIELKSAKGQLDSISIDRIKRILLNNLEKISKNYAQQVKYTLINLISTSLIATDGLRCYHQDLPKSSADKYRILKWKEDDFPLGWDQDQFFLEEPAFFSASAGRVAFDKILKPDEIGVLIYLPQNYQHNIKNLSRLSNEYEHLLEPGSRLIMKKIDQFSQWHIYQGTAYASSESWPEPNQDIVEDYIIYLLNNFYNDKEYKDIKICRTDQYVQLGEHRIYKPNHNLVHAARQKEYAKILMQFLGHFAKKNSDSKDFFQKIYAAKFDSIHTELALALMSLSIGRESEVGHSDNPDLYKIYRVNSAQRFSEFFLKKAPECKNPEDAFVKFFLPIAIKSSHPSEKIEIKLRERYQIYINILTHLGNPDYAAKLKGLELHLMQIIHAAHLLDHPRCFSRQSAIDKLGEHFKPILSTDGLKAIPILVDYAISCIHATGDRLMDGKQDYTYLFAEYSFNPMACLRKLRQVVTPIFNNWSIDENARQEIRIKTATKLLSFYNCEHQGWLMQQALPADLKHLADDNLFAEITRASMMTLEDGQEILACLEHLKNKNKLNIFYDKSGINVKFLNFICNERADISVFAIDIISQDLIRTINDLEIVAQHSHLLPVFLNSKAITTDHIQKLFHDKNVFVDFIGKLETNNFRALLECTEEKNTSKAYFSSLLISCLESKNSSIFIKKMRLDDKNRLLAFLDSFLPKDAGAIDYNKIKKIIPKLLTVISPPGKRKQFLTFIRGTEYIFLNLIKNLHGLDVFFNREDSIDYQQMKLHLLNAFDAIKDTAYGKKCFETIIPYIINTPEDLITLSTKGICRNSDHYDKFIIPSLMEAKHLSTVIKNGQDFIKTFNGLKKITQQHASAFAGLSIECMGVEKLCEFLESTRGLVLSSFTKNDYLIFEKLLPNKFLEKIFPGSERINLNLSSKSVFSERLPDSKPINHDADKCVIS